MLSFFRMKVLRKWLHILKMRLENVRSYGPGSVLVQFDFGSILVWLYIIISVEITYLIFVYPGVCIFLKF